MRIGNGFVLGVTSGALWGAIGITVAGIILALLTGAPARPSVPAGAIAGGIGAAVYLSGSAKLRSRPQLVGCWMGLFLLPFAITLGSPFNLPFTDTFIMQGVLMLVFATTVMLAIKATLWDTKTAGLNRYEREVIIVRGLKGLGFILFTTFVALPFYVMVMTSLKSQQELRINPLDLSVDVTQSPTELFRSYIELFTQFNFGDYLLNSAVVSVLTVVITLMFSVPGAYAVARLRFPGRSVLSRSVLLIYMVPAIVLVIPLYSVFSQLGLRNSLTGLLIIYPATTIPVALYMLQGYFRGLPHELEEAGLVDGLNRVGVILKITMPLSLPALASVSLYVFMIAWNEFLFAFMFLDNPEIFTLSRGVVSLNSSEVPRQHLMAGAVVATIPVLVIFLWFERFLVQGLTAGSVKG